MYSQQSYTPSLPPSKRPAQFAEKGKSRQPSREHPSCIECRKAKQRCETHTVATVEVSHLDPQPPQITCRRCHILQLECIIPDRKRKVSKKNDGTRPKSRSTHNVLLSNVHSAQLPSSSSSSSPPLSTLSSQYLRRPSRENESGLHFNGRNKDAPQQVGESSKRPISSSATHPNSSTKYNTASSGPIPKATRVDYEPTVPVSSYSKTSSFENSDQDSQLRGLPSKNTTTKTSYTSDEIERSWMRRARIGCRCGQLLEHLIESAHQPSGEREEVMYTKDELSNIVQKTLSNRACLIRLSRRMIDLQVVVPFLPCLSELVEEVDIHGRGEFFLGVLLFLENCCPDKVEILRKQLARRCALLIDRPPDNFLDICGLVTVARCCPLLVPSSSLVGVIAGNRLLLSAFAAANKLGLGSASEQLLLSLDTPNSPLPATASEMVRRASLWVYLSFQQSLLKVYDDPMPQSSYPNSDSHPHPRLQQQRQKRGVQVFLNGPTDSDGLEYYCRAVIEVDTRMRSKTDRSRLSMPSLDAKHCVSILMILYATRITEIQSQTLRLFDLTYQEQVWQTSGSEDCIEALRQWAFEMVEVLDKNTEAASKDLRQLSSYLGSQLLANATQLRYLEFQMAALDYCCLSQCQDRLFEVTSSIIGGVRNAQGFLQALSQRPRLMQTYEKVAILRTGVAKQILVLLDGMAYYSKTKKASTSSQWQSDELEPSDSQLPNDNLWPLFSLMISIPKWSSVIVGCSTLLMEELGGRFLNKDVIWGARGESRIEVYHMLVRQAYVCLVTIEEEQSLHYATLKDSKRQMQKMEHEVVRPLRVATQTLEKMVAAIAAWKQKASGIGEYREGMKALEQQQQQQRYDAGADRLYPNVQHLDYLEGRNTGDETLSPSRVDITNNTTTPPSFPRESLPTPPARQFSNTSSETTHMESEPIPFDSNSITLGDSLIYEILNAPIETFF